MLAFSFVRYKEIVIGDCFCKWDVTGGRAAQVLGGDRHFLPAVSPPALLAAGAGRIAVAPTADPWDGPENPPQPTENGPVNVLDPSTSTLVMSVSPTGKVRALALSAGALAVLVERTDGSLIIERYAIPAGTLISTPVDANAAFEELDISGKWIVYRVRRQIRIVDDLGGDHLLIEAPARPIGISIERGRRVAWAENTGQTHRIRAALAPLSRMSPSQ